MQILVKIGSIVKPYGLPPLNINTKVSVSMQYILNKATQYILWTTDPDKGFFPLFQEKNDLLVIVEKKIKKKTLNVNFFFLSGTISARQRTRQP